MANNASNYLENKLLNHIFTNNGGAAYTAPAANSANNDSDGIFLSLHTTAGPLDDNSGTGTEITLGSYARSNAEDTLTFTITGNSATNDQAIVFPQATANYDGQVTHIGIYDAKTGGNLLFHGALTVPKTVTTGDTMQINAGALTITME